MLQYALKKAGYDPVKIDGIYGDMTVSALAAYQKAIGYVPATGEAYGEFASRAVLEKLLGSDPKPPATKSDL